MSKTIQLPTTEGIWRKPEFDMIAKQLPVSFEEVKFHIKGDVLRRERIAANKDREPEKQIPLVDEKGRPLNSDVVYKIAKPQKINHHRRLRKAYKRGGQKAVREYIMWFARHHANIIKRFPEFFKVTTNKELIKRNT